MSEARPAIFKKVHVIGDSHALAFNAKSVHFPAYNMVATASVCYVRGLSVLNIINDTNIHPEIGNYLIQQKIGAPGAWNIALTPDPKIIAEQYATGRGFERHLVVFFVGEIYVRKFLGSLHNGPAPDFAAIEANFREVARKYVRDIKILNDVFGIAAIIHMLNPPTADDRTFESINNFRCPRDLRVKLYQLFNTALRDAATGAVAYFGLSEIANPDGSLKAEYEFDGVHADPRYALKSLAITMDIWLMSRGSEQSSRYTSWLERVGPRAAAPITAQPVTKLDVALDPAQVSALRESLGAFELPFIKTPFPDWAQVSPKNSSPKFNEFVRYAQVSQAGLKLLHETLVTGDIGIAIRACLGADFSLLNCRAVQSSPHDGAGLGQQSFHRDGCPPGILRGLIYLVDVDENLGPFEYLATPEATKSTQVTGGAGSITLFDANAVSHRAYPPRTGTRIAIDLVILLHPPSCAPIVHSHPFSTWPVDPYLFEYAGEVYPPSDKGRWFYPALIMPPKTTTAVKTLSDAELALGKPQ